MTTETSMESLGLGSGMGSLGQALGQSVDERCPNPSRTTTEKRNLFETSLFDILPPTVQN
ncbi:MAG: hypothetical protein VYE14_03805 [Verrucomicrobiota bacterium]|nr:hypothetical protein [Verrucomicrobiota bacterium]